MIGHLVLLAAAAAAQTPAVEPSEGSPITVRGQRIVCRRMTDQSANTRIGARRVCRTNHEWDEARDQAVELLLDMPRRNPRTPGRTLPELTQ